MLNYQIFKFFAQFWCNWKNFKKVNTEYWWTVFSSIKPSCLLDYRSVIKNLQKMSKIGINGQKCNFLTNLSSLSFFFKLEEMFFNWVKLNTQKVWNRNHNRRPTKKINIAIFLFSVQYHTVHVFLSFVFKISAFRLFSITSLSLKFKILYFIFVSDRSIFVCVQRLISPLHFCDEVDVSVGVAVCWLR